MCTSKTCMRPVVTSTCPAMSQGSWKVLWQNIFAHAWKALNRPNTKKSKINWHLNDRHHFFACKTREKQSATRTFRRVQVKLRSMLSFCQHSRFHLGSFLLSLYGEVEDAFLTDRYQSKARLLSEATFFVNSITLDCFEGRKVGLRQFNVTIESFSRWVIFLILISRF